MKIIERKIDDLLPAEYNPRQASDKQFADLCASLERFGAVDPALEVKVNGNAYDSRTT